VVAVEGGDDPDEMGNGLEAAVLDSQVGAQERLVEPRDLKARIILLRVEPAVGERLVARRTPATLRPVAFAIRGTL